MNKFKLDNFDFFLGDEKKLFFVLGPCVIEDDTIPFLIAEELSNLSKKSGFNIVYKASYDKANRSSLSSFRGPGMKVGLNILKKIKDEFNLPILTDVHSISEIEKVAEIADIIQIPAFLCRQTDLLVNAAKTNKPINVKKGQFMAPWDMKNVVGKIKKGGNNNRMIITERGFSFGYNNLVVDMNAIPLMKQLGVPVIFDATHSVQKPGGKGLSSDGESSLAPNLARSAVAAGCDGVFMEVHPSPDSALSDGANMIKLDLIEEILSTLQKIKDVV